MSIDYSKLFPIGYPIGRECNENIVIGIKEETLFMHTMVLGATGSGKSTTVATLINNSIENIMQKGLKVLILDWHGEYAKLLKTRYKYIDPYQELQLNPLTLSHTRDKLEILEIFEEVLELTGPQSYILFEILKNTGEERRQITSLDQLIEEVENYTGEASWTREVKQALLRKLFTMARDINLFSQDKFLNIFKTNSNVCIIDVSLIKDIIVRKLYVLLFLKFLFDHYVYSRGLRKNPRVLLVIEEIQNVFSKDTSIALVKKFVREVRKFGIGIIAITQSPSSILEDLMINSATKIIHSIRSSQDLELIRKLTKLPQEIEKILPVLDQGEAVLYTVDYKIPILVKITEIKK